MGFLFIFLLFTDENHEKIVKHDGVPVLVNLLQTVKGHEVIVGNTLNCIWSMTENNRLFSFLSY